MSENKIITSLLPYLLKYKQLPYVAIKKNSRWYLIPHRPKRPKLLHFNIATKAIKQHSLKYNQYFSSQKLGQKVMQKYLSRIQDSELKRELLNQKGLKEKWQQYNKKAKQYSYKYLQPFQLMAINSYCIFKKDFFAKIKEKQQQNLKQEKEKQQQNLKQEKEKQQQKLKQEKKTQNDSIQDNKNQNNESKNDENKGKTDKKMKSQKIKQQESIDRINSYKINKVWLSLSPQQKKVYEDKLMQKRQENEVRIKEFIRNHEVPRVKKYTTMSRFIAKYAVIYQLKLSDPQLYKKYYQLPDSEKNELRDQAMQMTRESKQRMEQYLRRWNISKQQLNYIIQVSDKYLKARKKMLSQKRKQQHRLRKEKLLAIESQQKDQDQDEDQDDYQLQEQEQYEQGQQTTHNDKQQNK